MKLVYDLYLDLIFINFMSEHAVLIASIGVMVASVAVVITFVGIYLSNQKTKESNDLLRKDLTNKLRPWMRIEGCKPVFATFSDGTVVEWKNVPAKQDSTNDILIESVKMISTLTNFGNTPCYFVSRMRRSDSMLTRDELINDVLREKTPGICMPQGDILKNNKVPAKIWDNLHTKHFFIGVGIIYRLDDTTEVEMGRIWEIGFAENTVTDDWYFEVNKSSLRIT